MKTKNNILIAIIMILAVAITGCSTAQGSTTNDSAYNTLVTTAYSDNSTGSTDSTEEITSDEESDSELFTDRDLEQVPDLADAVYINLTSGQNITIEDEGVYLFSGKVTETTIIVDTDDEAKVQLVLDGVTITNTDSPAVYIKSADKVFITSISSNHLEVTGYFDADEDTNLDAVIFSKDDLVLNGTGPLEVISEKGNGITSKDDLKVTGGIYTISSAEDSLEANDSIRIYDGDITIVSGKDALHCENEEATSQGYIVILGGTFNINAADDAIRGNTFVQIDGGTINIEKCSEGIEATFVQINGGVIDIYSTDDGINATRKTNNEIGIEVNGGEITISMASGDTDGFDSNGYIVINGGTISVDANSAFDADGGAVLNDGTVIINGSQVTEIPVQMMGGGGTKRR